MVQSLTGDDRDPVDVPLSEFHLTAKGRSALAEGDPELAPEALDILFAVAYWHGTHGEGDPGSGQPA